MYDFLLVRHCNYSSILYHLQVIWRWKFSDLEIWLRGHSRSLKLVPFESLGAVFYSLSILTMAESVAVCEIFSVRQWWDLENMVRVRSRSWLPAALRAPSAAMSILFLLSGPKIGFSPGGATRCPDKCEISHGRPHQISRLSGQKCGNTVPKTVKIYNFGSKFVPQGRLVCTIFTKFSAFVRVYR